MISAQSQPSAGTAPDRIPLDEKVQFLSRSAAYPEQPREVVVKETHMSWVFLAGSLVFKLKKPVVYPQLDFSTLAAREANCRQEVQLNARLAPDTYLGVLALRRSAEGFLHLDGDGEIVDWLVVMRRLPDDRMFDAMLTRNLITAADLARLATVLASFYLTTERADIIPENYADRFVREQALNRNVLERRTFAVDHARVPAILDRLDTALAESRPLLEQRVRSGQVVDGHGDLRPEHICLTDPIEIIDCLEFNRMLRLVDPFDELAFLGMECAFLGGKWIGPNLMDRVGTLLGSRPPDHLVKLYTASRAVLRARLSLAHLLDPLPREPAKWEPLAAGYLRLAEEALGE